MKKVLGEWAININFNALQIAVLNMLARKSIALTGGELRFIIDYLEMSTRDFAKLFGVSHAAVLKWEKEESKMNPSTEIYSNITPHDLIRSERDLEPLEVDANKIAC